MHTKAHTHKNTESHTYYIKVLRAVRSVMAANCKKKKKYTVKARGFGADSETNEVPAPHLHFNTTVISPTPDKSIHDKSPSRAGLAGGGLVSKLCSN